MNMRLRYIACLLFTAIIGILPILAETDPCDKYTQNNLSVWVQSRINCVYYDLSHNGTIVPPYVDSVWITTPEDTTNAVITSQAQSGECIDISVLPRGYYHIFVEFDGCVKVRMFIVNRAPSDITNIPSDVSIARKILRDGQLFIECDGKTYNAQGIKVE